MLFETYAMDVAADGATKSYFAFALKDRIVFTRKDKEVGVENRMLGKVVAASKGEIRVAMDGDQDNLLPINPKDFQSFDQGCAASFDKSKGAAVEQSYVIASRAMDRHLCYVSMTRHRADLAIFVYNRDRPKWAMEQRHQRARPKQTRSPHSQSVG
ncbi:MAG: hypothetical protein AAF667_20120 [Pseudomonadota bacterium]